MGIDEAGRGPVLGPMVYGCLYCARSYQKMLSTLQFAGLSKAANEELARDLPMMNGIKEDIKSIGVLDSGHPANQDALCNLSTRLKTLKEHSKKHFEEEEKNLLPRMEAAELSKVQQDKVLDQCLDVMHGTHSHLFRFFTEASSLRMQSITWTCFLGAVTKTEYLQCFG